MRLRFVLVLLALPPASLAGQEPTLSAGWSLTLGADGVRFGRTALDTSVAEAESADLRPSRRVSLRATLSRYSGPWRMQLEAGWAEGSSEINNEVVSVRDKTLDLSRLRLATSLERSAARLGAGELGVGLAPTLDLWRAGGANRLRIGVEGQLSVRVSLGRVALENRVTAGLSGGPLNQEDLGPDFKRSGLRWLGVGIGLRAPL